MTHPPIEDGAVLISGDKISWVGPWAEARKQNGSAGASPYLVEDLGEVILLPGLVNAHGHLDYTNMAGSIPPPGSFTTWIQSLVAIKATWTREDFAQSWGLGARMLVESGTTSVADIEAVPDLLPQAWSSTALRVHSFHEIIHLKEVGADEVVHQAANRVESWNATNPEHKSGLSPHAPYTTTRGVLEASQRAARLRAWPLTTHVSESAEEFEMFMGRSGPLFDWLQGQRNVADCGNVSPIGHLGRAGYLSKELLAGHVNYIAKDDVGLLADAGTSVVHCPRSHDYFGHQFFPFDALASAGINIALGTDSLATTRAGRAERPKLDMFAEMQMFSRKFPNVSAEQILQLATLNGAKALGLAGTIGELKEGAYADLITVPFDSGAANACENVVNHRGAVKASMISGRWVSGESCRIF